MKKTLLTLVALFLWAVHPALAITAVSTPLNTQTKSLKKLKAPPTSTSGANKKSTTTAHLTAHSTKQSTIKHASASSKKSAKTKAPRHPTRSKIQPATLESPKASALPTDPPTFLTPPVPMTEAQAVNTTPPEKPRAHWFGRNKLTPTQPSPASASVADTVTAFAHQTVTNLHHSSYKFGGNRFDPQHGVYMLDCSSYVDNLLHQSSPQAYITLTQWSGSYKPNSEHYYNFFTHLSSTDRVQTWNKVESPQQLKPGDILVFRYKNSRGKSSGGHVMLVMDKPIGNSSVLRVKVADSAETGHSADTRGPRASGIGIGTLLLKINPATGEPYAFAWRVDSLWNSRVSIAMGRPISA